jgi:diacylglycerol kinase (ATP)
MADPIHPGGPTRALVIANPASGSYNPRLIMEVEELCADYLRHTEVYSTTGPGDATEAVRSRVSAGANAPDLVVAIGGDGTVQEVVQGLVSATGPRAALLAVPGGTGNSGYKMLWGEQFWAETLKAVLADCGPGGAARLRHLDTARLEETGRTVYLGGCSGVIAEALVSARSVPQSGRARYARAYTEAARAYTPYPGRVTVDGHLVHQGPTLLANVGGGQYRGGQFLVLPHSLLDDGLLDVCVIGGEVPAAEVPALTLQAAHMTHPATVYARGRRITIERTDGQRLSFEHDGEYQQQTGTSVTLQVMPHALAAWAPAD